ncbi:flippase-like domain-containing protein [candidate division KSB1 bacterium]|nr:flippase-like domain-containing protein [candidate division KSB1 bacterium]
MSRKKIFTIIKLIITVLALIIIIRVVKVDIILSAIGNAHFGYFLAAAGLLPLNVALQYFRWRFLLRLIAPTIKNHEVFGSLMVGYTFGIMTPGRLGEYGRVFYLRNCSRLQAFGLSVLDKIYSMIVTLCIGMIGLFLIPNFILDKNLYVVVSVLLFILTVIFILLFFALNPNIPRSLLYSINIILPRREKIKKLIGSLDHFHYRQARILLSFCLAFYVTFTLQFFLLTRAFENVGLFPGFISIASTMVILILPISLANLGIRELAAVFFFHQFGIQSYTAFNAAFILFVINILIPSIIGILLIPKIPVNKE